MTFSVNIEERIHFLGQNTNQILIRNPAELFSLIQIRIPRCFFLNIEKNYSRVNFVGIDTDHLFDGRIWIRFFFKGRIRIRVRLIRSISAWIRIRSISAWINIRSISAWIRIRLISAWIRIRSISAWIRIRSISACSRSPSEYILREYEDQKYRPLPR